MDRGSNLQQGVEGQGHERMEVLCGESDELGTKVGIGQKY